MTDLKLCLGSFTESNEIEDEMRTLAEYGMTGKAEVSPLPPVLCYDIYIHVCVMSNPVVSYPPFWYHRATCRRRGTMRGCLCIRYSTTSSQPTSMTPCCYSSRERCGRGGKGYTCVCNGVLRMHDRKYRLILSIINDSN